MQNFKKAVSKDLSPQKKKHKEEKKWRILGLNKKLVK